MAENNISSSLSSSSSVESLSDPFHLLHSDSPDAVLVSPKLTGENYIKWYIAMTMALGAKNKLGFVNGTITKPSEDDVLFTPWKRANHMALSWILNSIHEWLVSKINHFEVASDVWDFLLNRFSPGRGLRIFHLQHAISTHQQGNDSVSVYFKKLKGLWDEISKSSPLNFSCSSDAIKEHVNYYQEVPKLMQFLMGLDDNYVQLRKQILLMDPLPQVGDAYSQLLQEEKSQRSIRCIDKATLVEIPASPQAPSVLEPNPLSTMDISSHTTQLLSPKPALPTPALMERPLSVPSLPTAPSSTQLYRSHQTSTISDGQQRYSSVVDDCQYSVVYPIKHVIYQGRSSKHQGHNHNEQEDNSNLTSSTKISPSQIAYDTRREMELEQTSNECILKFYNDQNDGGDFEHNHNVVLIDGLETCRNVCSWCHQLLSGLTYSCTGCDFFLHKLCYESPREMQHPFHPEHPLNLLPRLLRRREWCSACDNFIGGTTFCCEACSIFLHAECASLPHQVKHKRHKHPFNLIYSLKDDGSNEYYCDICEELLYEKWAYYCESCEYIGHLACVTPEALGPRKKERMKEGRSWSKRMAISDSPFRLKQV